MKEIDIVDQDDKASRHAEAERDGIDSSVCGSLVVVGMEEASPYAPDVKFDVFSREAGWLNTTE